MSVDEQALLHGHMGAGVERVGVAPVFSIGEPGAREPTGHRHAHASEHLEQIAAHRRRGRVEAREGVALAGEKTLEQKDVKVHV